MLTISPILHAIVARLWFVDEEGDGKNDLRLQEDCHTPLRRVRNDPAPIDLLFVTDNFNFPCRERQG